MDVTTQHTNILTSAIKTYNLITWLFYSLSSVQRLATGWTVRESNFGGGRDFPYPSRHGRRLTQPPVQPVPGVFPDG